MFRDKSLLSLILAILTLTAVFCGDTAFAQSVGSDEFYSSDDDQNKGRPFRDIPPKYPECADLVSQHWEMTDELYALAEERRGSVDPESRQTTQEINDLASQRSEVTREIQTCVRGASKNRLLKAKIERNVQLPPEETKRRNGVRHEY